MRCVLLLCVVLYLALTGLPAGAAAHTPPFLLLGADSPQERAQAQALLAEFFPSQATGWGGGFPGSAAIQSVDFTQDPQIHQLDAWPDKKLEYNAGQLYLHSNTRRQLLATIGSIDYTPEWPLAFVDVGDIDFDGQPDFFVLTVPAASGSFGYRLLDWDRKNARGESLFVPFAADTLPPSPDSYGARLFFEQGEVPNPNFIAEQGVLEFISRNGPYYDTERWCFAEGRYALCERIQQSYYAHADNMYEIARHVRFNRQGRVTELFCRALSDFTEQKPLHFAAASTIELYPAPGDKARQTAVLQPGAVVTVLDYRMVDDPEQPALWYRVALADNAAITGWCAVRVEEKKVQDGVLAVGWPEAVSFKVLGVRAGPAGAEVLVQQGGKELVLPSVPLMTPLVPWD